MTAVTISDLLPPGSRLVLTGGGKEFIERIGAEAARQVVLAVLKGENIRTQTEPLTQRRIAQLSGAMVALFTRGWQSVPDFTSRLSSMALQQIKSSARSDKASIWTAQWLIGLTGKSVQNVLRSNPKAMKAYLAQFEAAIEEAAERCRLDIGDVTASFGFVEDGDGGRVEVG